MKNLVAVKQEAETIKKLAGNITIVKKELAREIENIEGEGRSETWVKNSIASARQKALDRSYPILSQLQESAKKTRNYKKYWSDKTAVLSCIPLTKRGVDGLTAENPFSESITRMAILTEARLQSSERLKLSAEYAINEGRVAEAYLISLIDDNRAKVDLSNVVIPEQQAALDAIGEASMIASTAIVDFRQIGGSKAGDLLIDRLTAARGASI